MGCGLAVLTLLGVGRVDAQNEKLTKRVARAGEVLAELVEVPDRSPPDGLLADATCIAVVPGVVQAGLGIGGRAGFGVVSCRTEGGWSEPSFMGLKGGSLGLQIGGQSADVVLVFMNKSAPHTVAGATFNLGAGASIAAGPIGRNLSAETDWRARAEIYSYSKTKGLFAGINLAGTKWEIDHKANRAVYGAAAGSQEAGTANTAVEKLLRSGGSAAPALMRPFLASLAKNAK